jgi:hypothetical protein
VSARVGLLVTGKCEEKALAASLGRIFPNARFELLDRIESFTSADLRDVPDSEVPTTLGKFAASLVAAVEDAPPDMVVAIDDLEFVNAPHPELVARRVRDAVRQHLEHHSWSSESTRQKVLQRVRERCSFHLFAPMVEAYFFAEPAALARAGATRSARLDATRPDLEDFLTSDLEFLQHPDVPHQQKRKSWAIAERARHPKHYLRFLCEPANPHTDRYVETRGGAAALGHLAWRQVFTHADRVRLARSLFEDLAEGLGVEHPFPGESHPATSNFKAARVLRNL